LLKLSRFFAVFRLQLRNSVSEIRPNSDADFPVFRAGGFLVKRGMAHARAARFSAWV
jgi:hypothetical protein